MQAFKKRTINLLLFIAFCVFVVWLAVLSRKSTGIHNADLRFMWSYRELIVGDPNGKKDVLQNIDNVLFFMPFGALMPVKNWKVVLITAAVFSAVIEITQYIGGYGLCELDDVICNTLGAVLGYMIATLIRRMMERMRKDA